MTGRFPLRRLIPLALLLFIIPPIFLLSLWHYRVDREALLDSYRQQAALAVSGFQRLVTGDIAHGDTGALRQAVSSIEALPCFSRALGVDAAGHIFLASQAAWIGRDLVDVDPALAGEWPVEQALLVRVREDGSRVAAYQPISIGSIAEQGRQSGNGWLYLELDIGQQLIMQGQAASRQAAVAALVVLIFSLLLWRWIDRYLVRPLIRLTVAARQMSEDGGLMCVPEEGSAEMRDLARSFNDMNTELGRRYMALKRQRVLYQALSMTNQTILHTDDEQTLLAEVCEVAVEAGIKLVWIGYVDKRTDALRVVHTAGDESGWLETARKHVGLDNDPLAQAVRLGEERSFDLVDAEHRDAYWYAEALFNGFTVGAALPIRRDGVHVGGLVVMSDDPGLIDEDGMKLLREMASDLGFALDALDREVQRKSVEQSLARDRAQLRTLIDTVPDMIFIKDRAQTYLGCNRAFELLVAIPEKQLVGGTDSDIFPEELARLFHEQDREILQSGINRRSEEWMEYPDGRRVLMDIVKMPYHGPAGEVLGLIGIGRDITPEYRARETLRQTMEVLQNAERISHMGSLAYDPRTGQMHWSEGCYRILGVDSEQAEPSVELLRERCHPEDRETMQHLVNALMRGEMTEFEQAHRVLSPDGEIRHVVSRGRVVEQDGQGLRLVGSIQDITRLKAAEEERKRILEAMRQAQKLEAMGELTGGFARDLNNILVPILGFTELARQADDLPREKLQGYLQRIGESAERGRDLIAKLIAIRRGGTTAHAVAQELPSLAEEAQPVRSADGLAHQANQGSFPDRQRVLLVDDEPAVTLFMKEFLEIQGLYVEAYADSHKALQRFGQDPAAFDLLITDQSMPSLTGLELLARVRSIRADLPVILCTGFSERVNGDNAADLGVDRYLQKPVATEDLLEALSFCLVDRRHGASDS